MSFYEITEVVTNQDNEPLVMADGNILCHVANKRGETDTVGVDPDVVNSIFNVKNPAESEVEEDKKDEWNDEQSKYILDKYYEYLSEVGPMKYFRLKKDMWTQIAREISEKYKINRNFTQVENRYKTIMKRKKKAVDNNQTSGAKRLRVDFEEELKKISSIDDSIEPEVLQDQTTLQKNEKVKATGNEKTKKNETVVEYLRKINVEKKAQKEKHHQEREENKERRHKEKLELLKELFKCT